MKVLIAVDTTEFAHELLRSVAARKWPYKSEFVLVHAIGEKDMRVPEGAQTPSSKQKTAQARLEYVHDLLMEFQRLLPGHKMSAVTTFGAPAEMIINISREFNADIILVGHDHASKDAPHRVAETLVRHAPVTVEVVRAKGVPDQPAIVA